MIEVEALEEGFGGVEVSGWMGEGRKGAEGALALGERRG